MPPHLPRLELRCFGPPTARVNGGEAPREVLWRKHLALLIYLALSPRFRRSRDHLVGMFWGERPQDKARHALNQAVLLLRQVLGDDRLRSEGDALVLNDQGLDVDALRLGVTAAEIDDQMVALVDGDFLEGFFVEEASEFDEWVMRERERTHALAATVLVAAGERRLGERRFAEAGDAARRALARAARSEPAVRLLMLACALAGDAASALEAFGRFERRLTEELGERPSQSLRALAERIRTQEFRYRGLGDVATEASLVGRERAHQDALEAVLPALERGPRALVVTGPPGMGRTRLLSECLRRLTLEGALVVLARPIESDQDAPYSLLRLLLRAGLVTAPGLPGARPDALGALASVVPELEERFPRREVRGRADMGGALAAALAAIAAERPVALAVDDVHWADDASIAALEAAFATLAPAPVALLVTVGQGTAEPAREILQLQAMVGRSVPGATVRLAPMAPDQLATLVRALAPWCGDDATRDRLARRLEQETGGSPFFAVTLLRALEKAVRLREDLLTWPPPGHTHEAPAPWSIPSIVRHAIALRLGELGEDERTVLRAASVCGDVVDPALVAGVLDRPVADVERALPGLERRHLITFDGRRYTFAAPLVASVVRAEDLSKGERRRLERRAIEALSARDDLESRALRVQLLAHAAPDAASLELAIAVTRDAIAAGAGRLARRVFVAAEGIAKTLGLEDTQLKELSARL